MTDETGNNKVTKPAAETAPKPSRRQIAVLGAAAPVLLTLPVRGVRADVIKEGTEDTGQNCNASTWSAVRPDDQEVTQGMGMSRKKYLIHYSCIDDNVLKTTTKI